MLLLEHFWQILQLKREMKKIRFQIKSVWKSSMGISHSSSPKLWKWLLFEWLHLPTVLALVAHYWSPLLSPPDASYEYCHPTPGCRVPGQKGERWVSCLREAKDQILPLTDHVYPTWPRPSSWWRFNFKVFDRSLASEAEHGYATTLPSPGEEDFHQNTSSTKNSTRLNKNTKKPQGNR